MKWKRVSKNSKVALDSGKLICGVVLPDEVQGQLFLASLSRQRPSDIVLVTDEEERFYITASDLADDFANWAALS